MAATTPPDGFKLTLLGIAGQGAQTVAPHDFAILSAVPSQVLKDLFLERLNSLVALGVFTPEQVQAFKQLLSDVENGNAPKIEPKKPTERVTPESILRSAILNQSGRAARDDDTSGGSVFSFLADAFVTLGGGIWGAVTEGTMDGFVHGAAVAHQWAEEHIPTFV